MIITRKAYAKINYHLAITGIREDGYHLLDTWMQTVSLFDELTLEEAEDLILQTDLFPGPRNLAYRAAALLQAHASIEKGARITLKKHIPAGAGLGGGSADAAAVLWGLNELWGLKLSLPSLIPLAAKLGADVPFALVGGLARCRGVGEILEPSTGLTPYPMLLVFPGEGVSTVECYRVFDQLGLPSCGSLELPEIGQEKTFFTQLGNDLEAPALQLMPELSHLRQDLEETHPIACSMTGSGAAYFAIYETDADRARAQAQLEKKYSAVYPVMPVGSIAE